MKEGEKINLMGKISERYEDLLRERGLEPEERHTTIMDLMFSDDKVGLDLNKLLNFSDLDFIHDVLGIKRHIDRNSGELGGCFLPRCARAK
jgi:hypothetical protein